MQNEVPLLEYADKMITELKHQENSSNSKSPQNHLVLSILKIGKPFGVIHFKDRKTKAQRHIIWMAC